MKFIELFKVFFCSNTKLKNFKEFFVPISYLKNWWLFYLDCFDLLGEGNKIYKLRNGINLNSDIKQKDGFIINEIWGANDYTPIDFEIAENDTVVEIGGYKGYFTVFASKKAKKGKIYTFEPTKYNFNFLRKNLLVNKCNNVKSFQLGLAGKKTIKKFFVGLDGQSGNSIISDWFDEKRKPTTFTVSCISINNIFSLCKIKDIDFLKVDCEGAEYEIFFNTSGKDLQRIKKISMEFHQIGELKIKDLKKFLEKNNFSVKLIDSDKPIGMLYAKRKEKV
ncbi:FkbM family methyltransferase [Candidatus Microgenomates bacterium]|nr:MAG: FkbM family methyltransferase [Candidatus Microgenomates bacterium]